MSAHGAAWFAHRLDSWSKIAREKVKRAADLNNEQSPTNTSSDDGSTSTTSVQKDNSKDAQKSASSSFEVSLEFPLRSHRARKNERKRGRKNFFTHISQFCRKVAPATRPSRHRHRHRCCCSIKASPFRRDIWHARRASRARVALRIYIKCVE
jgi:hypothetical protein